MNWIDFLTELFHQKFSFLFLEFFTSKQMVQASLFSFLLTVLRKKKYNFWKNSFVKKCVNVLITTGLESFYYCKRMILKIKKMYLSSYLVKKRSSLQDTSMKKGMKKIPTNLIEYIFCTNIYLDDSMKRACLWKMKVKESSGMMLTFENQDLTNKILLEVSAWYSKSLRKQIIIL